LGKQWILNKSRYTQQITIIEADVWKIQ